MTVKDAHARLNKADAALADAKAEVEHAETRSTYRGHGA
jgi:hypothetical protein